MKKKLIKLLSVCAIAIGLTATVSVSDAAYYTNCKWVSGHWMNGYWRPGHQVCWTVSPGVRCGWVGGHWSHGYWFRGHKACWYVR